MQSGGQVVPCADARVCLLLRPIDLDQIKQQASKNGSFNPRLAHMFVEYVMVSPETQAKNAYAQLRTDSRGRFAFRNLPGDRWYYLLAQALGNMMVSWQTAVYLYPQERVQVVLSSANASLPIFTEELSVSLDADSHWKARPGTGPASSNGSAPAPNSAPAAGREGWLRRKLF